MLEITAALVKELRDKTSAGMMDCKKALVESDGDLNAATDWLRKKGIAAATKKSGRTASQGLVGVAVAGRMGAIVEVNSETDFVPLNPEFQRFVTTLAGVALELGGDVETLRAASYPGTGQAVADELTDLIAKIRENMTLRRAGRLEVGAGVVARYVHGPVATDLGKIGVLVALESPGDAAKLEALGKQLAMHVAAARPEVVSVDQVDPAALDHERAVLAEQARVGGKPEDIVQKIVEGRLRKYYEDVVLLEQVWVIDGESRVNQAIEVAATEIGAPIAVAGFIRFALGEGVDSQPTDFAAEVAATLAD
ncbi:MAG: translation elongation factor Ts [Alphaproteobacteria bacterium]